jgi:ankyrin repeat protein
VQDVKEVLEHGAEIEAKDSDGWTPLHWFAGTAVWPLSTSY